MLNVLEVAPAILTEFFRHWKFGAGLPVAETLKAAGVPSKISIYPGQPHAFVGSIEEIRKGGPSGQAWAEITTFFRATLKADTPPVRNTALEVARVHLDTVVRGPAFVLWLGGLFGPAQPGQAQEPAPARARKPARGGTAKTARKSKA